MKKIEVGEIVELKDGGSFKVAGYAVLAYPVTREQAQKIANTAIEVRPFGVASCGDCAAGVDPKIYFPSDLKHDAEGEVVSSGLDIRKAADDQYDSQHIIWCD